MDAGPIHTLLSETSEDEDILPSDDEEAAEEDPCDLEEHDSVEQEAADIEEEEEEEVGEEEGEGDQSTSDKQQTRDHYIGRDGSTKWHKTPPDRSPKEDLQVVEPSGPRGMAKEAESLVQMWKCFVTEEMLDMIVTHTNQKIVERYGLDYQNEITNKCEIVGVIGLLYLAGVFSSSRMKLEEFWADDGSGVEIFRAAMSLERFRFLLQNLRFEDNAQAQSRKSVDKLASVRALLNVFALNCVSNFSTGEAATIDEVRESFRGRCSFKRFMYDKPVHYGFKVYALCDSRSYYIKNLDVVADSDVQAGNNAPEEIVKRLVTPIKGTGRTVIVESSFASLSLAKTLLEEFNLRVVGNMSRKHPEIPAEFLDTKKRATLSSTVGYSGPMTLCSYLPENDTALLLLSTRPRYSTETPEEPADVHCTLELINYYNNTNGCVDDIDEICGKYSAARNCRSMPLTIFFALLNVAGLNTQVLHQEIYGETVVRRRFLKSLAIALVRDGSQDRYSNFGLVNLDNGSQSRRLLMSGPEPAVKRLKTGATRCSFCPRSRDRKTHTYCSKCNRAICKEHAESICKECFVTKDN
ncbi:hypothetical protein J437_LFUL009875 [Ladona fulva]|uniref:PiggyBac transposable element-derived protein domain-containing protein n=1 Tax=Ladona fulva TaxID=123851 RepID=A0A8K0NZI9_LADFU|nr:hypothetical protein J437_LFUL009875 [Ladona fulva]